MSPFRHLDLFSGIGGFSLAARTVYGAAHEVVSFCEIDPYCRRVLQKHWPDVPIIEDVRELDGGKFEAIDVLTGGPPCQPASNAGLRKGDQDHRWLRPESLRLVGETYPMWIVFENPTGILTLDNGLAFEGICSDLETKGYTVQAYIIPACAVDAPHRRDRVWIVAHLEGKRREEWMLSVRPRGPIETTVGSDRVGQTHADTHGQGQSDARPCPGQTGETREPLPGAHDAGLVHVWPAEWDVLRVVHGLPKGVDRNNKARVHALGNAIVPQVAAQIFHAIKAEEATR